MKVLFRRFVAMTCAVVMVLALVPSAFAAVDTERSYEMKVTPSSTSVAVGDEFTVSQVLSCNEFTEYPMYCLSSEVDYDRDYFEPVDLVFDEYSRWAKTIAYAGYGTALIRDTTRNAQQQLLSEDWHALIYNYLPGYSNVPTWKNGFVFATVTLRATKAGTSTIKAASVNVGNYSGMAHYNCALINASVSVVNFKISATPYVGDLYRVTWRGSVDEGCRMQCDGEDLYAVGDFETALVPASKIAKLTEDSFYSVSGSAEEVTANADVNGNGKINIVDAQVTFDLANGALSPSLLSTETLLAADVNGDEALDAADARAIQLYVHTGSFNEAA